MEQVLCKNIIEYNPNKINYWETLKFQFETNPREKKLFQSNVELYTEQIYNEVLANNPEFYCGQFCGQHNLTFLKIGISGNELGALLVGLEASQVTMGLIDSLSIFLNYRFGFDLIQKTNTSSVEG